MAAESFDPKSPAVWLRFARGDISAAEALMGFSEEHIRQVGHLAQQAAEKAIKGAMVARGIPFPRTHDLCDLAARIQPGPPVPAECLADFSAWSLQERYPGVASSVTPMEAVSALATAQAVFAWAEKVVSTD